jgi:hypothetical protein
MRRAIRMLICLLGLAVIGVLHFVTTPYYIAYVSEKISKTHQQIAEVLARQAIAECRKYSGEELRS